MPQALPCYASASTRTAAAIGFPAAGLTEDLPAEARSPSTARVAPSSSASAASSATVPTQDHLHRASCLHSRASLAWVTASRCLAAVLHLGAGWIAAASAELVNGMSGPMLLLLALRRAVYSAGALVYASKRPKTAGAGFGYHEVFHALTIVAAGMHIAAVASACHPQLESLRLGPVSASIRVRPGASQGLPLNGLLMPSLVSLTAASARSAAAEAAVCPTIRSTTPYSTASAALIQ